MNQLCLVRCFGKCCYEMTYEELAFSSGNHWKNITCGAESANIGRIYPSVCCSVGVCTQEPEYSCYSELVWLPLNIFHYLLKADLGHLFSSILLATCRYFWVYR